MKKAQEMSISMDCVFPLMCIASHVRTAFLLTLILGSRPLCADWPVAPRSYTNSEGFFCIPITIGHIEMSKGEYLPITISFSPEGGVASKLLGSGWRLNMLSSAIFQTDENTYQADLPVGGQCRLRRTPRNPTLLEGGGGWVGEIGHNSVALKNQDGWILYYIEGRLRSIKTPKGQELTVDASREAPSVRWNGTPVLQALAETGKPKSFSIVTQAGRVEGYLGVRPIVREIGGTRIIESLQPAIEKLTIPDRSDIQIEYAVDSQMNSTVKLSGARSGVAMGIYVWDPISKLLLSHNQRLYQYQRASDGSLEVKSSLGKDLSPIQFRSDISSGKNLIRDEFGGTITYQSFGGSSLIRGMERKGTLRRNGIEKIIYRLKVDEKMRPLEKIYRSDGVDYCIKYSYDAFGVLTEAICTGAGKEQWKEKYDGGRLSERITTHSRFTFSDNNVIFSPEQNLVEKN